MLTNEIIDNLHSEDWRLKNLFKIKTKKGEVSQFVMNETQKVLHASKSNYDMTLKGRQQGVSTYYILKYLNRVMFRENYTAAILSHDRESIEKLFRVVRFAYDNVMPELRPTLDRGGGSKYMMYFPAINSRIYVALEVRSESINALHVSEYAFMKNKDRFNASIEAVPADTGCVSIESTPFGMNHFYDDWVDVDFPYTKHFFPWFFHHENKLDVQGAFKLSTEEKTLKTSVKKRFKIDLTNEQINWRRFKIKQKSKKSFKEEHPEDDISCFLSSGNSVLDLENLASKKLKAPVPIEEDEFIKIWHEYSTTENYVMGCDTAEGVGTDYSVATVLNIRTREEVAKIRGHIKPKKFAEMVDQLARRYSGKRGYCLVGIERNNHGHAVLLWLESKLHYPNIFKHDDDLPGWKTNMLTRPIMIDTFIDAVDNNLIHINDPVTYDECMTLVDNKGKIEAMQGKHDDAVISAAIALQMCLSGRNYLTDLMKL